MLSRQCIIHSEFLHTFYFSATYRLQSFSNDMQHLRGIQTQKSNGRDKNICENVQALKLENFLKHSSYSILEPSLDKISCV